MRKIFLSCLLAISFLSQIPYAPAQTIPPKDKRTYPVLLVSSDYSVPKINLQYIQVVSERLNQQVACKCVKTIRIRHIRHSWFAYAEETDFGKFLIVIAPRSLNATEVQLLSTLEHEFGHVFFNLEPEVQKKSKEYFDRMTKKEREYFTDGNFTGDGGGAPWEEPGELFASAFMIASLKSEGWLVQGIDPPKGAATEFWQYLQTLPLFHVKKGYETDLPMWNAVTLKRKARAHKSKVSRAFYFYGVLFVRKYKG